jgi:uncharacterized protein
MSITPESLSPTPGPSGPPPESITAAPLQPAPMLLPPSEERLSCLDLIRGVAILGILPANLAYFCGPVDGMSGRPSAMSPADRVAGALILLLVNVKFITMLSILFGVGLGLQFDRAQARGDRRFPWYYLWRQFLLLLLGLSHALLIWDGDILTCYGAIGMLALGLVLLGWVGVRVGVIVGLAWFYFWMLLILVFVCLMGTALGGGDIPTELPVVGPGEPPTSFLFGQGSWENRLTEVFSVENQLRLYRNGNFGQLVEHRALFFGILVLSMIFLFGWYVLACFLLGVEFLRRGLFHDPQRRRTLTRWFVGLGLGIGVPCHVVAAILYLGHPGAALPQLLNQLGALSQALLYLGLLLAWDASGWLPGLQAALRAVGRMALTNYLMQSVLCTLFFNGYGLGMYGRLGLAGAVPVMAGVWLLELTWSPLWLRYFRMGPVEWLWRTLSGRRPFGPAPSASLP